MSGLSCVCVGRGGGGGAPPPPPALGTTRAFTQPGSQGPLLPVERVGEGSGNDVDIHSPRRILQFAV